MAKKKYLTAHFINLFTGLNWNVYFWVDGLDRNMKQKAPACEKYVGIRFVIKIFLFVFMFLLEQLDDPFAFIAYKFYLFIINWVREKVRNTQVFVLIVNRRKRFIEKYNKITSLPHNHLIHQSQIFSFLRILLKVSRDTHTNTRKTRHWMQIRHTPPVNFWPLAKIWPAKSVYSPLSIFFSFLLPFH